MRDVGQPNRWRHSDEYMAQKRIERRAARLERHSESFLQWADEVLEAGGLGIAELKEAGPLVCRDLMQLAGTHGQLAFRSGGEGSLCQPLDSCVLCDDMSHLTFVDKGVPLFDRPPRPETFYDVNVDPSSWRYLHTLLNDHFQQKQERTMVPQGDHTSNMPLMESLLDDALEHSWRHRWYDALVPRNQRHRVHNSLQEVAIAEHLVRVVRDFAPPGCDDALDRMPGQRVGASRDLGSGIDAVVDFGGGNGILSYMLGQRLACDSVVIDPYVPGWRTDVNVCAEDPYFRRVVSRIEDVDWRRDVGYVPHRSVFVSKHLCGSGIDALLRMCGEQHVWPRAMVLSSCCHHKSSYEDYISRTYLQGISVRSQDEFLTVARRSSWLASERPLWMQRVGATAEALLDLGRVLWLRQRGYAAFSVVAMSSYVSPRNRMIVAWRRGGLLTR